MYPLTESELVDLLLVTVAHSLVGMPVRISLCFDAPSICGHPGSPSHDHSKYIMIIVST